MEAVDGVKRLVMIVVKRWYAEFMMELRCENVFGRMREDKRNKEFYRQ